MGDKFDWHNAALEKSTIIGQNYKNTQNVRRFFISDLGDEFKFNRPFMAWLKANTDKTLGDACSEYLARRK